MFDDKTFNITSFDDLKLSNVLNNNMLMSSLLVPIIAGLVTTFSNKILNTIVYAIAIILHICYVCYDIIKYKTVKLFKLDYNAIIIHLSSHDNAGENYMEDHANSLIWYINQFCAPQITQIISTNRKRPDPPMFSRSMMAMDDYDAMDRSVNSQKYTYLPLPVNNNRQLKIADSLNFLMDGSSKNNFQENYKNNTLENYNHNIKLTMINKNCFSIVPDIYGELIVENGQVDNTYGGKSLKTSQIDLIIRSKKSMKEMHKFLEDIHKKYNKHQIDTQNYDNLILMYSGGDKLMQPMPKSQYGSTYMYDEYKIDESQTFENLFLEQKDGIIKMVNTLNNAEYYREKGLKRKFSALFIGESGTGKTATVVALANYLKRVIIYVPINRIEHDGDIEKILYSERYNSYIIPNDKKIFLFDEIDSFENTMSLQKKKKDMRRNKSTSSNGSANSDDSREIVKEKNITTNNQFIFSDKDKQNLGMNPMAMSNSLASFMQSPKKFNIGTFLNLLDGTHNQDGMIIIATANKLDGLDAGLYRAGRLTKIIFKHMGKHEIAKMIGKYFSAELTKKQIQLIRDDKCIPNLILKNICIENLEAGATIDNVINAINEHSIEYKQQSSEQEEDEADDIPIESFLIGNSNPPESFNRNNLMKSFGLNNYSMDAY